MRKSILSLAMLVATTTCGAQTAHIGGVFNKIIIDNQRSTSIVICRNINGKLEEKAGSALRSYDKSFSLNIGSETGLLNKVSYIGADGEFYPVYLGDKDSININVEGGNIKFSGKIGKENELIARWFEILSPLRTLDYSLAGRKATPQRYHVVIDSVTTLAQQLISGINTGNVSFDAYMKKAMPFLLQYDITSVFMNGIEWPRHQDYPQYIQDYLSKDVYNSMDVWHYSPQPFDLMLNYAFAKTFIYNFIMGPTLPWELKYITCPELRGEVILSAMERNLLDSADVVCKRYASSFVTPKQKVRRADLLRKYMVNKAGNPWIDFAYEDANGKKRKLSDFKGKVVLVDVWATWCPPCKKEIPYLLELEKEFAHKNIVFIGASFDTDRAAWKKMLKDKNMGGVQLISYRKGPLVSDYQITEIPRFMVFSKTGKTVNTNAPRPSDPALKQLLEAELKK